MTDKSMMMTQADCLLDTVLHYLFHLHWHASCHRLDGVMYQLGGARRGTAVVFCTVVSGMTMEAEAGVTIYGQR